MNKPELVIAMYRPKPGRQAAVEALVKRHFPVLKECGLTSERPSFIARSTDGTIIEVFEWASPEAARAAHENPKVGEIWGPMSEVCDFMTLSDLAEAKNPFPNFTAAF